MGLGLRGVRCTGGDDSIGLLRQADATAHAGDIRSDGGTDGRRRSRGMGCLSDICLVGLSALVPVGTGSVDMLVPVSTSVDVEEDALARQRGDARRQHRGGRQYDADAAHQCLPVHLFGADGLYDGFAHADHDGLPAQDAGSRGSV